MRELWRRYRYLSHLLRSRRMALEIMRESAKYKLLKHTVCRFRGHLPRTKMYDVVCDRCCTSWPRRDR